MRKILSFSLFLLLVVLIGCKSTADGNQAKTSKTMLEGQIAGCEVDSIRLFVLDGMLLKPHSAYATLPEQGKSNFAFTPKVKGEGFYYLGQKPEDARIVFLGKDKKVTVTGGCNNFKTAAITNSASNAEYATVIGKIDGYNRQFNQFIGQYRSAAKTKVGLDKIVEQMKGLDSQKLALIDSLKKENPYFAAVVGARTYISYQAATGSTDIAGEPVYFAENFFAHTDFSHPVLNELPILHENFKAFAGNISRLGFNAEQQRTYVQAQIDKIPAAHTSAQKLALAGAAIGFQSGNPENFIAFSDVYSKKFPLDNPQLVSQLNQQAGAMKSRTVGAVAPEISLPTPEGEMFSLSQLRGKIVLIDFWASWCGPCRRENPNVKRAYDKYKSKGFEILSVSLDKDKTRWVQAIEKDKMNWYHISDLKHWKSVAAKTYGVSSIPHTVLLDREGKIVASKLRGAALERKLEELLGDG